MFGRELHGIYQRSATQDDSARVIHKYDIKESNEIDTIICRDDNWFCGWCRCPVGGRGTCRMQREKGLVG